MADSAGLADTCEPTAATLSCDTGDSVLPIEAALSGLDPFLGLTAEMRAAIGAFSETVRYQVGDTIASGVTGDLALLYGIASGEVRRLSVKSGDGAIDVEEVGSGAVIGLGHAITGRPVTARNMTIMALTAVELVEIDAVRLADLIFSDAAAQRALLIYFAERSIRLAAPAADDASPERRLHQHLLTMVVAEDDGYKIPQMPRHTVLAEACGTDPRTAAVAVGLLIEQGIARRDYPGLAIEDISALRRLAY